MIRSIMILMLSAGLLASAEKMDTRGLRVQGPLEFAVPVVEVKPTIRDDRAPAVFTFRNATAKTLRLVKVQPVCGCTTFEVSGSVFAPGEGGTIKSVLHFENMTGQQRKRLIVTTAVDGEPEVQQDIAIKADIPAVMKVSGNSAAMWMVGQDAGPKAFTITAAEKGFGRIVEVVPPANGSFTTRLIPIEDGVSWTLEATPVTLDVPSNISALIELVIDVGEGRRRSQNVWCTIILPEAK